ncbi:hypothetical protein CFC21_073973 [Triticum aestivum]|uniref:TF-B3 domain-containing protein n=2 Tax=Triticum aestivum TaxID=4565 RepID=A0A9R1HN85_WHEAT|nr:uncharacterized protein LOC123117191 [Triticum aestivum]KAF7068198.1 hypothetical protein CFC21_073973 [Triticum aestivum]
MTEAPRDDPFSSGFRHADTDAAQPHVEKYLLPLKKRAATTSDGGDRSSADGPFVVPPKKRRVVDTGGEGTSTHVHAIPVQSRPRRVAACNIAYVSMEEEAGTPATGAAGSKKNRNRNRNMNSSSRKKGPRAARGAAPLVNRPLHLSVEQQQHLKTLGATAPQFVFMKTLQKSDVEPNQNRLLFSCKREFIQAHPITWLLAEEETYFVQEWGDGLSVSAMDDRDKQFNFKLKYLDSNGGYRFIGPGWKDFVAENKLLEPVSDGLHFVIELWAFRSPLLPAQPEGPDVEGLEGHPDGTLGFLFRVYHDESTDVHRGGEEERRPVQKTKRQAPAKAVPSKKLAGAGAHASQGQAVARDVTRAEIVEAVGEETADALFGLLMLRSSGPVPMLPFENASPLQIC